MALRLVMEHIQYIQLTASKTILCQAVLTAKGGIKVPTFAICGFDVHLTDTLWNMA